MNVDGKENVKLGILEKGAGGRDEEVGAKEGQRGRGQRPGRNEGGKIGIADSAVREVALSVLCAMLC